MREEGGAGSRFFRFEEATSFALAEKKKLANLRCRSFHSRVKEAAAPPHPRLRHVQ